MKIEIRKNQICEQERTLPPGTYTLGRGSQCDIILIGNRISRKHALLTITDNGWEIEDLGSANGVLVDGKKIKSKNKLSLNTSFSMGGFTFLVKEQSVPNASGGSRQFGLTSLLSLGGRRPYLAALCLLILCCLTTVFWMAKINKSYLSTIVQENEINRALSIAENLGYHNQGEWNTSDLSQLEISFFEEQPGVTHVFLLDKHGRILAPIDQVNHVLQYPLVAVALASGKTEHETMKSGHLLICSPVKNHGETVGVAVVQYQIRNSVNLLRDRFWQFVFGLIFVLAVAVLFAIILVKMILQPWIGVGEALELTMAEDGTMLAYGAPYKELDSLKTHIERLLLKNERSKLVNSSMEEPFIQKSHRPDVSGPTGADSSASFLEKALLKEGEISCLIEGKSNEIVDSSPEFQRMFQLQDTSKLHILEVFQDPLLLTAMIRLVEAQDSKSETVIENTAFILTREEVPESSGYVLIRFEVSR